MDRSAYDRFWNSHGFHPSRGPVAWKGPHHHDPDPDFRRLCDEAERAGGKVRLTVGGHTIGWPNDRRRQLAAIHIESPEGWTVVTQVWTGEEIGETAKRALAKLESEHSA